MGEDARQPVLDTEPAVSPAQRNPKRRFVGRRTAEAQAKQKAGVAGTVEEGNDALQKGQRRI